MKYLLLTILLLSCSRQVLTVSEPIADVSVVVAEDKPIFQLGMPFGDGSVVEPVESMPVWVPAVDEPKVVCASIRVDTVFCPDTFILTAPVLPDTVIVEKVVRSHGLAYLMLYIGFVFGIFITLIWQRYK